MTTPFSHTPVSPLRQMLINDMNMRHFSMATQWNHIRNVERFASFLRRPPDTATTEDVRQFQLAQSEAGVPVPTMNSVVSALRFFFANTLDRPDLARKLVRVSRPRNIPMVLSRDEVARLLNATTTLKHQAALSVAYGAGSRVGEVTMLMGVGQMPTITKPCNRAFSKSLISKRRCLHLLCPQLQKSTGAGTSSWKGLSGGCWVA